MAETGGELTHQDHSGDIAFLVNLETNAVERAPEVSLASIGLRERRDLQEWVKARPELVGKGLLLVTSEFDRWEIGTQRVPDRLDVLFVDVEGAPVVAELKRDRAPGSTELQALKYAAFCAQLTVDDLAEEYAAFHGVDPGEAMAALCAHAPVLADGEPADVKIRLVAGSFGPAVTSVVLWLRDHHVDIGCVEVTAREVAGSQVLVTSRLVIPLPEAEDYLVRRRRKEQVEEERRFTQRRNESSVVLLSRLGICNEGDVLQLKVDQFTKEQQPKIRELLNREPAVGRAVWTSNLRKALQWEFDGECYTPTGLTTAIMARAGIEAGSVPGPDYWLVPTGRSMYQESKLHDGS